MFTKILQVLVLISVMPSVTFAERVDIFTQGCDTDWDGDRHREGPIVLFLIDDSHTMKYHSHALEGAPQRKGGVMDRIQAVREGIALVMEKKPRVRMGLIMMGNTEVNSRTKSGASEPELGYSYVAYPATNPQIDDYLDSKLTAGEALLEILDNNDPEDPIPLADLIYESYLYLTGGPVGGRIRASADDHVSHPNSYTGGQSTMPKCTMVGANTMHKKNKSECINEKITGNPVYTSPITHANVPIHLVFVSDGLPDENFAIDEIEALVGKSCMNDAPELSKYPKGQQKASCITSLVDYMSTQDLSPLPGTQSVTFHTLGLNTPNLKDKLGKEENKQWPEYSQWLKRLAQPSGGKAMTAKTYKDLLTAIRSIVEYTYDEEGPIGYSVEKATLAAPVFSSDSQNIFNNDNDVYLNVFSVESPGTPWMGNLKRFELKEFNNPKNTNGPKLLKVVGANQKPVYDESTGDFSESAQDTWSGSGSSAEGTFVSSGGAASLLPANPLERRIFSNLNGNSLSLMKDAVKPSHFPPGKPPTKEQIDTMVGWLYGDDGTGNQRYYMGDSINSNAVVLNYNANQKTVFFSTNQGLVHAIDGHSGKERYAFMPSELIPNLEKLSGVNSGFYEHTYGMDGPLVLAVDNRPPYEALDASQGDQAILYASMGRGGRGFYTLDVTDPNTPTLLWDIQAGKSAGFNNLGQTWSKPVKTKIRFTNDGEEGTDVLIFTGGYDSAQDTATSRQTDNMGNAIYIVDAYKGHLLWSISNSGATVNDSDMNYSIPAGVTAIDLNQDGFVDQFHVGDVGGQLWSFYVKNDPNAKDPIEGGVIADVAGAGSSDHRRFYISPDVLVTQRFGKTQIAIIAGTGGLESPINTDVTDGLYVVLNDYLYSVPTSSELGAMRSQSFVRSTDKQSLPPDVMKWYIPFPDNGEKLVAKNTTINNALMFSTFVPYNPPSACALKPQFKQWMVSLETGLAIAQESSGDVSSSDNRSRKVSESIVAPAAISLIMSSQGLGLFSGMMSLPESSSISINGFGEPAPYADRSINGYIKAFGSQE